MPIDCCSLVHAIATQFVLRRPRSVLEQGAAYGNDFERRRSLWTAEHLRREGFEALERREPDRFGNQMLLADYADGASCQLPQT